MQVEYTYLDDKNFLGNTLPIQWGTDNKDPLIYQSGTYDYSTVETHYLAGTPVRSVKRTFNRFHSLILQTTTQGDNIQETETFYPLRNGSVLDQPNTYQLPTQVISRWRLKSKSFQSGTQLRFAGYRYSTEGYRDFDEAVRDREHDVRFFGSRRSRLEAAINQKIGKHSSVRYCSL